jgi:3-dehydroquinate synthetase
MFTDKKVVSGKVRFIVPTTPGISIVKGDINSSDVIATLKEIFG